MKILVFGVIYSGVEKYLIDYFNSLGQQTYTGFDILIIEDGMHLPNYVSRNNLITKESKEGNTPADIRFYAIDFAKNNNYDVIIFTDCDDYFSKNRVEKTMQALKRVDFCVNKLIPIDEIGNVIGKNNYFNIPSQINMSEILNANYFGMSNTAINIISLPKDFYIPSNLIAVDWWLYSILLLHNKRYIYDEEMITYYRQHDNNLIGISSDLVKDKLFRGIDTKLIHYQNLIKYCEHPEFSNYKSILSNLIKNFGELKLNLENENFLNSYMLVINKNKEMIKTGWWSEILPLNEWSEYE